MRWLLALPLLDDVGGWEKLLHQALLVGFEGFELLDFDSNQGVEAAQAIGDALLFGERAGNGDQDIANLCR